MPTPVANTYSYLLSHSFEACVDELLDAGFTRIEAMIGPGHLWPDALDTRQRSALEQRLRDRGVELVTLNQPNLDLNLVSLDPAMREHSRRRVEDAIRLAADLRCARVVVGPGKANPLLPAPRERLMPWLVEALEALVPQARSLGVRVLLENMPFAFLPRMEDLTAVIARLAGLDLGLVYDVANGWFAGEDLQAAMAQGGRWIEVVHVSDTGREHYAHAPIGAGSVPWREAGAGVRALPMTVPIVAEIVSAAPSRDLVDAFARLQRFDWPVELPNGQAVP